MQIGVIGAAEAAGSEARLDRLAEAEAQGYAAIWLAVPDGLPGAAGRSLFPAARLAQRTEAVRIGMACPLPENLHPLRVAEEIAVLDIQSGGRVEWAPGNAPDSAEGLEIVLRAWRGEAFAHQGDRYAFPELRCLPRPEQRPHPRLWLDFPGALPAGASPGQCGRWLEGRLAPEAAHPDPEALSGGGSLAVVCPVSAGDPGGPDGWQEGLAQLEARWKPDWLLVWPERDADEALAARTQRRFAEVAAGFSA